MDVKIYRTSKTAMQSGRAKVGDWVLEYERKSARKPEALMGWSSSADTRNQVQLKFETREAAISYAEEKGWTCDVRDASFKKIKPRSYMDNFRYFPPLPEREEPKPSKKKLSNKNKEARPNRKTKKDE